MPAPNKVPALSRKTVNNIAMPVAAIVISILLFIFLVIPKSLDYFKVSGTINQTNDNTKRLESLASALEQIDPSDYKNKLTTTEQVLPTELNAPSAISQVQAVLSQANVTLTQLTFSSGNTASTATNGPADSFNVSLQTESDLDSIKNFISQIEGAPQIMKLNGVDIATAKNAKVDTSLSLTIYYQALSKVPSSFTTPVTDLSPTEQGELGKIEARANQPLVVVASVSGTTGKPNPFQ